MPSGMELMQDQTVRLLVYGPSGFGKTNLFGEMLKYDEFVPLHVLDFDLRINSLMARYGAKELKGLVYEQFRDREDQAVAFIQARAKLREWAAKVRTKAPDAPRTIVVDSLSFALKAGMGAVMQSDRKALDSAPQLQHYGAMSMQVISFVSQLCAVGCNVVVTAHERTDKDEMTGLMTRGLDVTKMLKSTIPGYFNELWHAEVNVVSGQPPKFQVRTVTNGQYPARTCYKELAALETHEDAWRKIVEGNKARATIAKVGGA